MPSQTQIVCPHCGTVNRVPTGRLGDRPNCGRCKRKLFPGYPVELSEADFHKHITANEIPVLVEFWAPSCGPCQIMAPAFARAAALLEPRMRLAKVDTERERGLAGRYFIQGVPTLALFKAGREVARQPGALDLDSLLHWARSVSG